MNEKESIEAITVENFLNLYNRLNDSNYLVVKHSDSPDFICNDSRDNKTLNIEITMTQDKDKDIQSLLGRSMHRNIDSIKEKIQKVKNGELHYMEAITSYSDNTLPMLFSAIEKKLKKDYGKSVLLVVRDTSPLNWDHSIYIESISKKISIMSPSPQKIFDKGIYLISSDLSQIYKLSP